MRRRRERGQRSDQGTTLIEVLMAMSLFSALLGVVMAGTLVMTRSTLRADSVASSTEDLRETFLRMDRQVRYASAINRPTRNGQDWYVAFRTQATAGTAAPQCTQWRVQAATRLLQSRVWADSVGTTPGGWTTMGRDIQLTSGVQPFTLVPADTTNLRQRLTVTIDAVRRDGSAQLRTQFVARNSSKDSVTNNDANADGRSDVEVCSAGAP